ncbi:MAG: 50S ribosomal protein L2 [Patescibacteria group bacterium]
MVYSKLFTKKEPEKRLLLSLRRKAGRSTSSGRITVRHQGGGVKRLYRIIDFGQEKINVPGKISAIEYDPNRTSFIGLVEYNDGDKRYVILAKNLNVGDSVICADNTELKIGNRTKLKNIPIGTEVYNIEIEPGKGGKLVRGAGTAAKVIAQEPPFTHLEMPSGESRKFPQESFTSLGVVSHEKHTFEILGKAGLNRKKGIRPTVRGTAMNPVDHPHGGGEGKTTTGLKYSKTPWGKPARGVKTRKRFWTDRFILKRRQKKNKK